MAETVRVHNDNAPNAMMVPAVLEKIRSLSDDHMDREIADLLNREGYRTARNCQFTDGIVRNLRGRAGIKKSHAGEPGYYTPPALAALLGISDTAVIHWCEQGKLEAHRQGKHCTYWIKLTAEEIQELRKSMTDRNKLR